jgi:peptidyl-prolyl cis-trans isomerase B (cyclophilin B)
LAAARDENAAKASSNCQFYIVEGKLSNEQELTDVYNKRVVAANPTFKYTTTQKEIYARLGGTHLFLTRVIPFSVKLLVALM